MNTPTLPTNEELVQFALEAMPRFCWTTERYDLGNIKHQWLYCEPLGLEIGLEAAFHGTKTFIIKSEEAPQTGVQLFMTPEQEDQFHSVFIRACGLATERAKMYALERLATIIATTKEP